MTPRKRTNAIKKRFSENQPLNLSAVENECPELLEGLFDPDNFMGWRGTLEKAGIDYSEITVFVNPEVKCRLCEYSGVAIYQHISATHGMTSQEYREEFPDAEVLSESKRSEAIGNRHDTKAKIIEPHWEPAWSYKYLLDRMFTYWKNGVSLNYANIAKLEPGMAAYSRRIFGSWDESIRQIGLVPEEIRQAKEDKQYTDKDVLAELKRIAAKEPDRITLPILAQYDSLIRRCFLVFGSYEAALVKARLDPTLFIPALDDPKLVKLRQTLINAAEKRLKLRNKEYDPDQLARFLNRYEPVISHFYVNWINFAQSIGAATREVFHSPEHYRYDSKDGVITGLKTREASGLSISHVKVSEQDRSLVVMAVKHFGDYKKALTAAGLEAPSPMMCAAHYKSGEEVLRELRRRYHNKESLYHIDLLREDTPLIKWSKHYYGGLREALEEAGIPNPGTKPFDSPNVFTYPDKESVLSEIRRRYSEGESIALSVNAERENPDGDFTLYKTACRHFDSWLVAVAEAGFPTGIIHYNYGGTNFRYYCKEDVIDAIQRNYRNGGSLYAKDRNITRNKGGLGISLYLKAEQFFGSYIAAVEAAGIDIAYTDPETDPKSR